MEPISHYFYSHRLKLQFWDWGTAGKPTLLLVHGGLDHARNWDWVARALRDDFHVYALDLRGHGNSAQAPGALYSIAEHVLDLSALADIIDDFPLYIIGHSLGGIITLHYAGIFPESVKKAVVIEGLGPPPNHRIHKPAPERYREWIAGVRKTETRDPHSYPDLQSAVARMKEANPHLSDEVAQHLTLHGTNWNSDGSLVWKFDNFARGFPPYGTNIEDARQIFSQITCPVLLFWGMESWAADPSTDGRANVIQNHRLVKVANAGHWVHHDQLDLFLAETKQFLAEA
ncbi:MAG: alpha/beta hydrolase [Acidobacteria bacterium]|nr:alpha/beta hydrolase [Acidobacteriota bacterium]MBI3426728.1 alpha/beta hydrolase [Acidobacteriota bacterium]